MVDSSDSGPRKLAVAARWARRCPDCPGFDNIACGISDRCPPNVVWPSETPEEHRERRGGERWARWLRRYAPWLRPILLEWIVEPVAQLVNAIIDERMGDKHRGK